MRSFFLDANALVYWVHGGAPQHGEVAEFVRSAIDRDCRLYILSSSINEVYYALHTHYLSESAARIAVRAIAGTFDLVDLTGSLVFESIESDEPDYEDGLVRMAAERLEVDAIVSYDKKAFRASFIPKCSAAEAANRFFAQEGD